MLYELIGMYNSVSVDPLANMSFLEKEQALQIFNSKFIKMKVLKKIARRFPGCVRTQNLGIQGSCSVASAGYQTLSPPLHLTWEQKRLLNSFIYMYLSSGDRG